MTEQEQCIAIHKWLGRPAEKRSPSAGGGFEWVDNPMPDYVHDLNAMAESEAKLTFTEAAVYERELMAVARPIDGSCQPPSYVYTAAQRCEALLRTIGKWHD